MRMTHHLAGRGSRLAVAAAVAGLALGTVVGAQSAPSTGEGVLQAMHDRYAKTWYHTLTFTQQTTLRSKADTMIHETWLEKASMPGRLRIDMKKATGGVTYLFANDSTYVISGDSVVRRPGGNYLLTMGFDVYAQPVSRTVAFLTNAHYQMSPVHEDTWEGRPVYVIGAAAGDVHSKQLWIDKERLLFVRGIGPAADTTQTSDTRFENYVQVPGGGWVSEKVEFFTDGKLRQQEEYSDVRTNVHLDPKIFTPPAGR
jgi:outer membrane lipoprotein-sorting protein